MGMTHTRTHTHNICIRTPDPGGGIHPRTPMKASKGEGRKEDLFTNAVDRNEMKST